MGGLHSRAPWGWSWTWTCVSVGLVGWSAATFSSVKQIRSVSDQQRRVSEPENVSNYILGPYLWPTDAIRHPGNCLACLNAWQLRQKEGCFAGLSGQLDSIQEMVSSWTVWSGFLASTDFPIFSLSIRINRRKKGGHLETPAHYADRTKEIEDLGEGSQELTNDYCVPGTVLDTVCTSSHVIFTTILGCGGCSSLSTEEKNEVRSVQIIYFKSLSMQLSWSSNQFSYFHFYHMPLARVILAPSTASRLYNINFYSKSEGELFISWGIANIDILSLLLLWAMLLWQEVDPLISSEPCLLWFNSTSSPLILLLLQTFFPELQDTASNLWCLFWTSHFDSWAKQRGFRTKSRATPTSPASTAPLALLSQSSSTQWALLRCCPIWSLICWSLSL